MVLDKIFGGISNIDPKYWDSPLQGQGFDKESATRLNSIINRRNIGIWGSFFAAVVAIPLSSRARQIVLKRYKMISRPLLSVMAFNNLMMASK